MLFVGAVRRHLPIMRHRLLLVVALTLAGCGTDVSGPSPSLYACVFGEPVSLAVGDAVTFEGTGHRGLCLTAPDGPATFLYAPFFAGTTDNSDEHQSRLAIAVEGAGLMGTMAFGASPSGLLEPEAGARNLDDGVSRRPRLDDEVHRRIRAREIRELEPRIRARPAPAPAADPFPPATMLSDPQIGDLMELNVAISCSGFDIRTARVMSVSEHAVVVADLANPSGFATADYAYFATMFDSLIHPVATRHFGAPSDIDGNGRTIIFFTRAVNELTPPGSSTITAAVSWAGDLFPTVGSERLDPCPGSNEAEIFYLMVPDPTGSIGPARTVQQLRHDAVHIIGHEYQHLVNAARRLYVNGATVFEHTWLNEGLSHIAEELLFYEASGLAPRSNITLDLLQSTPGGIPAFNQYMSSNHHNVTRFLERPDTASLMGLDWLPTRGAAWSFLRYASDRTGAGDEEIFFRLVNSTTAGLRNLDQVLGAPALRWIQDWAVGLYADDHVPGLAPALAHPSWNFRDIYRETNRPYPLVPGMLLAGTARELTLQPGGAGYIVFGVEEGGRAAIHVESDGRSPPPRLRGTFLRIH